MGKKYILVGILLIVAGISFIAFKSRSNDSQKNLNSMQNSISRSPLSGSGSYVVDVSDSVLNWQGSKTLILNYVDSGVIALKDGKIKISNGKIVNGEFTIDMKSISAKKTGKNTGESYLTSHLMSADFFDSEKFPISKFVISSVDKVGGENSYTIKGNLTIKDVTQPIEFKSEIYNDGNKLIARGEAELDRTNWNIKYGSGKFFNSLGDNVIDDKFKVALQLTAVPEGV